MKQYLKSLSGVSASLLLVGAVLALSGCVADDEMMTGSTDAARPVHGSDRYPITVGHSPVTLDIDPGRGKLTSEQSRALRGFVAQAQHENAYPLVIDEPSAGGVSNKMSRQVAAVLAESGVPRERVQVRTYPAPADASVRVSYMTSYARTKPCGNWNEDLTQTGDNKNYPNLGCAVQANIAAMTVGPNTLATPRASDPKQADTAVTAIQRQEQRVNSVTIPNNYKYEN